jgi:thiazole synthase
MIRLRWYMSLVVDDPFIIAGKSFTSRLLMGTGLFPNQKVMLDALSASGTDMVTVAVRRMDLSGQGGASLYQLLQPKYAFLPNTAGCKTAAEAVYTAELSREALGTPWIKLEVIGDDDTLWPDAVELLKAAETLIDKGFTVLPYTPDDLLICKRLADMGCAAIMPLAAPIGSGLGIRNPHNLQLIRQLIKIPLLVDAGIGTASDAALAMELGMDGVLLNSAVAKALNPVFMARAMAGAVTAGRQAYLAGRMSKQFLASASTLS